MTYTDPKWDPQREPRRALFTEAEEGRIAREEDRWDPLWAPEDFDAPGYREWGVGEDV